MFDAKPRHLIHCLHMMVLDRHHHFKRRTTGSLSRLSLIPLWHWCGQTHLNVTYPNLIEPNMLLKWPPECCCVYILYWKRCEAEVLCVQYWNCGPTADHCHVALHCVSWLICHLKVSTKFSDAWTVRKNVSIAHFMTWIISFLMVFQSSWILAAGVVASLLL